MSLPGPGPETQVCLGEHPPWSVQAARAARDVRYTSAFRDGNGLPVLQIRRFWWEGTPWFELAYSDGTQFTLDGLGSRVWGVAPEAVPLEDLILCFMGPVLGFVLRLHRIVSLHASALSVGGRGLVLIGPAGVGKSTVAAAMVRQGHGVLCDNLLALRESGRDFWGQPGCPRLRLWLDSALAVCDTWGDLPRIAPNWEKRFLNVTEGELWFQREPVPIAAIYVLVERSPDPKAPCVEDLCGPEAFISLVANSYVNWFLDKEMRAQEFEVLSRLVARVPLRRVKLHSDIGRLAQARDLIIEDFERLAASPGGA